MIESTNEASKALDTVFKGLARGLAALAVALPVVAGCGTSGGQAPSAVRVATYLGSDSRAAYFAAEPAPAGGGLAVPAPLWSASAPDSISAQPLVNGKVVYWGSWDGYEHATTTSGAPVWAAFLGRSGDAACDPSAAGVAGTPTLASVGGVPTLYVAGASARFFALNARTGSVIWKTALGSAPAEFIWGSPALYAGSLYVGVAAFGECAPSSGRLVQLDAATGAIRHLFEVVPRGCSGGGIWGSAAVDDATGIVYVATGDSDPADCSKPVPHAQALVALRASDLGLIDSWQVPLKDRVPDGDFGSTPTLFTARIGGRERPLLGAANKNGYYYAFDRDHIGRGPVWSAAIARGGSCPYCGDGSIASSSFDGTHLFIAGGATSIDGTACAGGLRALDPATGAAAWQLCLTGGPVLAAVVSAPGLVLAASGPDLVGAAPGSGEVVYRFAAPGQRSAFLGPAWLDQGIVYAGTSAGNLYALGAPPP
jgi:outer membrane protein assembly factor BamB